MNMQEVVRLLHAGEVPPKPLNGKGERYSASTCKSIDTEGEGCERRHWFEQVVGIDPPTGPALGIGTKVHGHVERALKKGTVLDVSPNAPMEMRLAARGLPHLPPHGTPGMHIERQFKMGSWPGGPEFTGTIDLMVEPQGWAKAQADGDDEKRFKSAELLDHKTTGSYTKYAAKGWALSERTPENEANKSRKFLDDDVQNIAYSTRMLRWFDVDVIKAGWVYYSKDFSPIVVVRAEMQRGPTLDKWRSRIVPLIEKMHVQHKQRPALAQVEANESACGNYGGCPHKAYCVDYKGTGARTMGKLSAKLLEEHDEPEVKKSKAKEEAPAMNPPPATVKSPFATMGTKEDDKPKATKGKKALFDDDEAADAPTASSAAPTSSSKFEKESNDAKPSQAASPKTSSTPPPAGAGFALFLGCDPVVSKRTKVDFTLFLQPLIDRVAKAHKVASIGVVKYDGINHTVAALEEWLDENGDEWANANIVVPNVPWYLEVATRALYTKAQAVSKGAAL